MQKAGIIGCGWLGLKLATRLIANGFEVVGTTTRSEQFPKFLHSKVKPFEFKLGSPISNEFFKSLNLLIVCLPISNKNSEHEYLNFVKDLAIQLEEKTNVIFTSSISVYSQNQLVANEETGILDEKSINFIVEIMLKNYLKNNLSILRLGGLIGEDRHPINFLSGKSGIENGNAPINLVHREDVIKLIISIIDQSKFNETYNCVYPFHPSKRNYYKSIALQRNLTPPNFTDNEFVHKIVDGQKATKHLDFCYQFHP